MLVRLLHKAGKMSYDLWFTLKNKRAWYGKRRVISHAKWREYFSNRRNYQLQNQHEAHYENEDTGVYFHFEFHPQEEQKDHVLFFNMNYCRSHIFAQEALREVEAVVRAFELEADDPQLMGMGTGSFYPDKFISGWENGNQLCYGVMKERDTGDLSKPKVPRKTAWDIWKWNYNRHSDASFGYQPKIMMLGKDDLFFTGAVLVPESLVTMPETDLWVYFDDAVEGASPIFIETTSFRDIVSKHSPFDCCGWNSFRFISEEMEKVRQAAGELAPFRHQDLLQWQWHDLIEVDDGS